MILRTLFVAIAEVRTTIRLVRLWTFAVLFVALSFVGYFLSCSMASYVAPYSLSLGITAPLYLLGDIDPTYFLVVQLGALFLLFDSRHRIARDRIVEVLDAKPVANVEYIAGSIIGTAILLWIIVCTVVLLMQISGLVSKLAGFDFLMPFQFRSVLSLVLLDAPVLILAWCSMTVFLSTVLRSRLVVASIAMFLMLIWLYITLEAPFSVLSLISSSSSEAALVSDIQPQFATWQSIGMRGSFLIGSVALIVASALCSIRSDTDSVLKKVVATTLVSVLCGLLVICTVFGNIHQFNQSLKWRDFHASYQWTKAMDLQSITGNVHIDPLKRLEIELAVLFSTTENTANKLVFTFNPGMKIRALTLGDQQKAFVFQNGLLEIPLPKSLDANTSHVLRIEAQGRPDPRFGYFDSAVNHLTDGNTPVRAVKLFGKDASLYGSRYVALMPGAFWYPVPGPVHGRFAATEAGSDYFNVDLSVTLAPSSWMLVGTGVTNEVNEDQPSYNVISISPVPEIGLFASKFERVSLVVEEATFNLYLHKRHARVTKYFEGVSENLAGHVQDSLKRFADHKLAPTHVELSFVEVPSRLRTIGGGWRMDSVSVLPGVVLLKEFGFPTTQFATALNRIEEQQLGESELKARQANLLIQYFQSGLGTDNPWHNLAELAWSHATSAKGTYAATLDQVMQAAISTLGDHPETFFSVYSTLSISDLTRVSVVQARLGISTTPQSYGHSRLRAQLAEMLYGRRISVWTVAEEASLAKIPSSDGHQRDLEFFLFKTNQIAQGLLGANEEKDLFSWISCVRAKHSNGNYTYGDLAAAAHEHGVVIDPFLTTWLWESSLPGFVGRFVNTRRIADDEFGNNRYQSEIEIRNTEAISGIVAMQFPPDTSRGYDIDEFHTTPAVLIPGNSAKRIRPITTYPLLQSLVRPYLSLNREAFVVTRTAELIEGGEEFLFEESSDWSPSLGGIIVDDLTEGFVVDSQGSHRPFDLKPFGPLSWIQPAGMKVELDNGLPNVETSWHASVPRGRWQRNEWFFAYGLHRNTYVLASMKGRAPPARFVASLPERSDWMLEYHMPFGRQVSVPSELSYLFSVSDGFDSWPVEFHVGTAEQGWNSLGTFDLKGGDVVVDLVGLSEPGTMYADAIRWSRANVP